MPTPAEFFDEAIAKGKLANLMLEEFSKKQEENRKGLERYTKQIKDLEQAEKSAHRTRMAGAAAGIVAYARLNSAVRSLRQSGLENTAEARRQQIAYSLLGREVAAVFLPATTAATNATMAAAHAMGGLNEKGQNLTFVLSTAVTGLVTFKAAQIAATAAGLKFSGAAGGIVANLGKIGALGGLVGGLAAIFLSSETGAKALETTMRNLVVLANELGGALDEVVFNPGKFWDDFRLGLTKIGENMGLLERGAARKFYDETTVPNKAARGGLDERRAKEQDRQRRVSPGVPSFGAVDSFERIQLAAAKVATGKDIPAAHLRVSEEMLEVQKRLEKAGLPNLARLATHEF